MMFSQVITENLSGETKELAFNTHGEVLVVVVWNVRTLMDVASQAVIVHTLSKYHVPAFGGKFLYLPATYLYIYLCKI